MGSHVIRFDAFSFEIYHLQSHPPPHPPPCYENVRFNCESFLKVFARLLKNEISLSEIINIDTNEQLFHYLYSLTCLT
jgi:hypothetical protein